jgi:hypothetical protein
MADKCDQYFVTMGAMCNKLNYRFHLLNPNEQDSQDIHR